MIIAKSFHWEAAHRIPWHEGKCKNIHGHSYKMIVELEGETNPNGVVMDFSELKDIIKPYIQLIDHTTIISVNDKELLEIFEAKEWKYYLLPFDSTAENLCNYFASIIIEDHHELLSKNNIKTLTVQIAETASAYASKTVNL